MTHFTENYEIGNIFSKHFPPFTEDPKWDCEFVHDLRSDVNVLKIYYNSYLATSWYKHYLHTLRKCPVYVIMLSLTLGLQIINYEFKKFVVDMITSKYINLNLTPLPNQYIVLCFTMLRCPTAYLRKTSKQSCVS